MTYLRTLATRRWLAALAVALLVSTACFYLGRWQWHRHLYKSERARLVETNYDAAPTTLDAAFPDGRLDPEQQWRQVEVTGRYDLAQQVLVRNRPRAKSYGFEALVPLVLPDGRAVLVDRGWLPFGSDARDVPDVPGAFAGQVTVTGWARPGEHATSRADQTHQVTAIDLSQIRQETGMPLLDGYLVLRDEVRPGGAVPERPVALLRPDTDKGPHLAYTIQWWSALVLAPLLVLWGVRRQVADERAEAAEREGLHHPGTRPSPRRRTRLWDTDQEEDDEYSGVT